MPIVFVIILSIIVSFFIPKKYLKIYMYFAAFGLVLLYAFFSPPYEYDLYRHYQIFSVVEKVPLSKLYLAQGRYVGVYLNNYPVYMFILSIISRSHMKALLPISIGCVVYGLSIYTLYDILERKGENRRWIYCIGFMIILCLYDYIGISGVRNIFAVSIFSFCNYQEMVLKRNKIACMIIYVACCFIHTICFVYLLLRIVVLVVNNVTRYLLFLLLLSTFFFTKKYYEWIFLNFSRIKLIRIALNAFYRFAISGESEGATRQGRLIVSIFFYITFIVLCIFFKKYILVYNKYSKYVDFVLVCLFFTVGSYNEYSIFIRFTYFVVPFFMVIAVETISQMHMERFAYIRKIGIVGTISYLWLLICLGGLLGAAFLYYSIYNYYPITKYIHILGF